MERSKIREIRKQFALILVNYPQDKVADLIEHAVLLIHGNEHAEQVPTEAQRLTKLKRTLAAAAAYRKEITQSSELLLAPKTRRDAIRDHVRGIRKLSEAIESAGGWHELIEARRNHQATYTAKYARRVNQARADGKEAVKKLQDEFLNDFKAMREERNARVSDIDQAWRDNLNAVPWMERLLKDEIAKIPRQRGRPLSKHTHLVEELALAFFYFFETMPKASRGGDFHKLAAAITGEKDPDRAVRRAVAAAKASQPT